MLISIGPYLVPFWNVKLMYMYVVTHVYRFIPYLLWVWGTWNFNNSFMGKAEWMGVIASPEESWGVSGLILLIKWIQQSPDAKGISCISRITFLTTLAINKDNIMDVLCLCLTYGYFGPPWPLGIKRTVVIHHWVLAEFQALCKKLSISMPFNSSNSVTRHASLFPLL